MEFIESRPVSGEARMRSSVRSRRTLGDTGGGADAAGRTGAEAAARAGGVELWAMAAPESARAAQISIEFRASVFIAHLLARPERPGCGPELAAAKAPRP